MLYSPVADFGCSSGSFGNAVFFVTNAREYVTRAEGRCRSGRVKPE